jgi:hypothetical protein
MARIVKAAEAQANATVPTLKATQVIACQRRAREPPPPWPLTSRRPAPPKPLSPLTPFTPPASSAHPPPPRLTRTQFPYSGNATGGWTFTNARSWTSGFYPGFLWGLYNLTGRPEWRVRAEKWTMGVANLQRDWSLQHDFGFVYIPSFGKMYEATASDFARRQVLAAAEAMAWSFNPATNSTRTFEGWDPRGATKKFRCGGGAGSVSGAAGGPALLRPSRVLAGRAPAAATTSEPPC